MNQTQQPSAKQQVFIKLGHSAYSGANAARNCFSKAQAIRVLRARGMKRDTARAALARECDQRARRGYIDLDGSGTVECAVLFGEMPYGWPVTYDELKARCRNQPEA